MLPNCLRNSLCDIIILTDKYSWSLPATIPTRVQTGIEWPGFIQASRQEKKTMATHINGNVYSHA
jgi:hypothetical protein